jgi:hypothetical protein
MSDTTALQMRSWVEMEVEGEDMAGSETTTHTTTDRPATIGVEVVVDEAAIEAEMAGIEEGEISSHTTPTITARTVTTSKEQVGN